MILSLLIAISLGLAPAKPQCTQGVGAGCGAPEQPVIIIVDVVASPIPVHAQCNQGVGAGCGPGEQPVIIILD